MGQLEKYGLYVMCLVIFLILGVTLWGEPANASKTQAKKEAAIHASLGNGSPLGDSASGAARRSSRGDVGSLLKPQELPPKYESAGDGDVPVHGGGKIGDMLAGSGRGVAPKPQPEPQRKAQPKPQPKTKAQPAPKPARRQYTVRSGDSYARIAKRELKSERHTALLMSLNKGTPPNKLRPGQTIVMPSADEVGGGSFRTVNKAVANGAYRTYVISKGDTFDSIARLELGSIKRVRELKAMNSTVNPRRLQIGQPIKLPLK